MLRAVGAAAALGLLAVILTFLFPPWVALSGSPVHWHEDARLDFRYLRRAPPRAAGVFWTIDSRRWRWRMAASLTLALAAPIMTAIGIRHLSRASASRQEGSGE